MNLESAKQAAIELFKNIDVSLPEETPERFVKMLMELTAYSNISNQEIADTVNKTFEIDTPTSNRKMVMLKDIETFSLCEHHIALMYDMRISIAYIPVHRVIGLSKIVRLADMVCKRLQLQEKIAEDIIEVMSILNESNDIAVHIKAKHSCLTARGIHNPSTSTITTNFSGIFKKDVQLQTNFLNQIL
jgi:GTP cyclohydrolase I